MSRHCPESSAPNVFSGLKVCFMSQLDFNLYRFRLPVMRRLVELGASVWALAPKGEWSHRFAGHGVQFLEVPVSRSLLPTISTLRTLNGLARRFREVSPDVVHTFTVRGNLLGAWAASRAGVPVLITSVTGLGSLYTQGASLKIKLARWATERLTRRMNRKANAVIFQNPDDIAYYIAQGLCSEAQAHLIVSSGVDLGEFSPSAVGAEKKDALRSRWGIQDSEVVVLMVSRLLRSKGVPEFLEAARRLHRRARFVLIGHPFKGNPDTLTWDDISEYRKIGAVTAPGFQDDVLHWLSLADVFVLPSYYREGVPRTILEAMAMGLPIVTTDSPGCRETVEDGENGILVPPKDVCALEQALATLIEDPKLRCHMARNSRSIAERRFSADHIADQYIDLYRKMISPQSRSGHYCAGTETQREAG